MLCKETPAGIAKATRHPRCGSSASSSEEDGNPPTVTEVDLSRHQNLYPVMVVVAEQVVTWPALANPTSQ